MKPKTTRYTTQGQIYRARVSAGPDERGRWRWRREQQQTGGRWKSHGTIWARPRDAQRLLRDLHRELTAEGPLDRAGSMLDLVGLWLAEQERRASIKPATLKAYTQAAKRLTAEGRGLRGLLPIEVDASAVEAWLRAGLERPRPYASTTLAYDLQVLGFVWAWGQRQGDVPHDLELRLPKVKATPRRQHSLAPGEVDAVLAHLPPGPTRRLLLLARATGARRQELYDLRWSNVSDGAHGVELYLIGKTGPRCVPVGGEAAEMLRACRAAPSEPVLGPDPLPHMETLSRRLHAAQEAAGTPRWTWHALRRLAVDIMARRGIDIATAAAITGHTPTVMLEHYRRVSAADLRRAAAELGGQVLPFNPRGRESS